MIKTIKTVKAKKVRPGPSEVDGDFIPGLDNAYVVDVSTYGEGSVTITFHDANGNEGTIDCWDKMPITVERRK